MVFITGGAASGKTAYAAKEFNTGYKVIDNYKDWVRSQVKQGLDPVAEAEKLLSKMKPEDKVCIIGTEMGGGIVPMDETERQIRELNGRVNCLLAEKADTVIRMICGLPEKLK